MTKAFSLKWLVDRLKVEIVKSRLAHLVCALTLHAFTVIQVIWIGCTADVLTHRCMNDGCILFMGGRAIVHADHC